MKLSPDLHLACCTNVHRGETWPETFESLNKYTLPVREQVSPGCPFGLGVHLSNRAALELTVPATLLEFQRWLGKHQCYVCTLNGVAFGQFRGARIKEQLYETDWRSPERVVYTNLLFDLLSRLLPEGLEGTVSTLPGSYKGFHPHGDEVRDIRNNLWHCVEHVARVSEQSGRKMHLGLEPEPLCLLESSGETLQFFDRMRAEHPRDSRLTDHLAVVYDACHFAVEFEEPQDALLCLKQHGIKIGKIDVSCALRTCAASDLRESLAGLVNDRFLHPVVVRRSDGQRFIYADVGDALQGEIVSDQGTSPERQSDEWRIRLHVPLNSQRSEFLDSTWDHMAGVVSCLSENPGLCSHLEIEASTWEMPSAVGNECDLPAQIIAEYQSLLTCLAEHGLANVVAA